MSDDIVTRLRESVKNIWADYSAATGKWAMEEAADEIERLRADRDICLRAAEDSKQFADQAADEIERLRNEVARLSSFLHPIGMVIHEQVVRGE